VLSGAVAHNRCYLCVPAGWLVKKHLDTLRDGVQLLRLYDAELTEPAIQATVAAYSAVSYQAEQIKAVGVQASSDGDSAR